MTHIKHVSIIEQLEVELFFLNNKKYLKYLKIKIRSKLVTVASDFQIDIYSSHSDFNVPLLPLSSYCLIVTTPKVLKRLRKTVSIMKIKKCTTTFNEGVSIINQVKYLLSIQFKSSAKMNCNTLKAC